jgi:hypothetical protein
MLAGLNSISAPVVSTNHKQAPGAMLAQHTRGETQLTFISGIMEDTPLDRGRVLARPGHCTCTAKRTFDTELSAKNKRRQHAKVFQAKAMTAPVMHVCPDAASWSCTCLLVPLCRFDAKPQTFVANEHPKPNCQSNLSPKSVSCANHEFKTVHMTVAPIRTQKCKTPSQQVSEAWHFVICCSD